LVLVETGFGTRDFIRPSKVVRAFTFLSGTRRDVRDTALHQVARLGYDVRDVQHIVLTHLHLDHAGGLPDFPWATVHVHALEYEAAMQRQQAAQQEHHLRQAVEKQVGELYGITDTDLAAALEGKTA
jgi:glyoxylase-like metal-dependent hydrolase (beta-lactamase superfamily II)